MWPTLRDSSRTCAYLEEWRTPTCKALAALCMFSGSYSVMIHTSTPVISVPLEVYKATLPVGPITAAFQHVSERICITQTEKRSQPRSPLQTTRLKVTFLLLIELLRKFAKSGRKHTHSELRNPTQNSHTHTIQIQEHIHS